MLAGTYSSIFVAVPLLDLLKRDETRYRPYRGQIAKGSAMSALMNAGEGSKVVTVTSGTGETGIGASQSATSSTEKRVTAVLTHPPRPRKKRR
jgi:hypothetical protein